MKTSTWYTIPDGLLVVEDGYLVTDEDEAAVERLSKAYPDAPIENLEVCEMLCESAREQVLAYAPTPGPTDDYDEHPPMRLVLAQLHWIKRIWDAGKGEIGPEGFTFTPRILEQEIQAIVRPRDGKPHVL